MRRWDQAAQSNLVPRRQLEEPGLLAQRSFAAAERGSPWRSCGEERMSSARSSGEHPRPGIYERHGSQTVQRHELHARHAQHSAGCARGKSMWDASQLAVNGTLRVTTLVPTSISGVGHLNDGNFGFTIAGGVGQAYSVRASTDVAAPVASWTVLESGNLPSANYTFTDLNATNFPARFYIISTP